MTYHDFLNAGTFFPKFMKIKLIARDNENRNIYTSWIVFKLKKTIELSIYSWCQIVYNLFWVWKKEGHLLEGKVESTGGECDKEISRIIGIFIKLLPFFFSGTKSGQSYLQRMTEYLLFRYCSDLKLIVRFTMINSFKFQSFY